MADRNKRKSGRAQQREEWIQVHQRLAQLPDTRGGKHRNEKVVKLTALLRERENKTDQSKLLNPADGGTEIITQDGILERKETETEKLVGKTCHDKTEKIYPIGRGYENELDENTSDSTESSTETRTKSKQTGSRNNLAAKQTYINTMRNNEQVGVSRDNTSEEGQETNKSVDEPMVTKVVTVWDYDEQSNKEGKSGIVANVRKEKQSKVPQVVETEVGTVQIKKELVDKAADTWMMDTDINGELYESVNDRVNESANDSEMIDHETTSLSSHEEMEEDVDDTGHPFTQGYLSEDPVTGVSKRKSVNEGQSIGQQKRLHMMEDSHTNMTRNLGIERSSAKLHAVESASEADQIKDQQVDRSSTHKSVVIRDGTVQGGKSTPYSQYQTDSDKEWEQISHKIRTEDRRSQTMSSIEGNKTTYRRSKMNYGQKSTSDIKLVLSYTGGKTNSLKERGASMLEDRDLISTPVTIEFNLVNTTVEFHILKEVMTLFKLLRDQDHNIKIYDNPSTKMIWEENMKLMENDKFVEAFKMKEQTFRRGNKKITLHCTIESQFNINRLKYSETVKNYIFERNVWLKPDLYSTKVVSSPGFMTLVHPKITNKEEYIRELTNILQQTKINGNESVVREWKEIHNSNTQNTEVPKFHLETNMRKWGGIKTEVLTVQCTSEDAKYVKYLFAEAGTQGMIQKGQFVPSGIHLMEGKDVMRAILSEQQEFLDNVTSFHLSGISYEDMKYGKNGQESIQDFLYKCKGVQAIESTYQTAERGSWLLVVEKEHLKGLSTDVGNNLAFLYQNRGGQTSKVVENRTNQVKQGYRLILVDNSQTKVGTYAEVLKRRLSSRLQVGDAREVKGSGSTLAHQESSGGNQNVEVDKIREAPVSIPKNKTGSSGRRVQSKSTDGSPVLEHDSSNGYNGKVSIDGSEASIQKSMRTLEDSFTHKFETLVDDNKKLFSDLEKTVERKIDQLMEAQIRAVSKYVSNSVTARIMRTMAKYIPKMANIGTTDMDELNNIVSPSKSTSTLDSLPNESQSEIEKTQQTQTQSESTTMMLQELENIEVSELTQNNDSPHDKHLLESSTPLK